MTVIDASDEAERARKSDGGQFLGTVAGSKSERMTLAESLVLFHEAIAENMGRDGRFAKIALSVEIRDGKLVMCDVETGRTLKPRKGPKNDGQDFCQG